MQNKDMLPAFAIAAALAVAAAATDVVAAQRDRFPIDLGELRAKAEQRFNAADADSDGLVTAEEFAAADLNAGFARVHHAGKGRCADRVGRVEERERRARKWAAAGQEDVFGVADADADGQLSMQEFKALPTAVRSLRQQRLFERFDANADGSLSLAEFPSRLMRLQTFDANADGYVSRDEMPQNQRLRGDRRPHRKRR